MRTKYIIAALLLASAVLCSSQMHSVEDNSEKYPFLVSLRVNNYYWCVGTIVASKWVLTAASCLVVPHNSTLSVQYGVKKPSINGPNVVSVKRVHRYRGWSSQTPLAHNIALVELEKQLPIDFQTVAPVLLPPSDYHGEKELPTRLISWALNMNTNKISNKAEKVSLMMQSNEECDRRLKGALSSCGNVCTSQVVAAPEDSCFVFGAPLLYGRFQVGIAEVQNGQGKCRVPSLYTKVQHYTPWIRSTIRKFTDTTGLPGHSRTLERNNPDLIIFPEE